MIFTKGIMIEQIAIRLNGGNPSSATKFWDELIALTMNQCINTRLKADFLTNTLAMGETIPEGCMIMTYSGEDCLTVEKYGENFSMCKLPAMPVKLMRDMGVFHVSEDGDEGNPFIPVQAGMYAYYIKQGMISDLLGQIGYTPGWDKRNGAFILFYKDLTALEIEKVMVKLVLADVFSLGDYDALPITAEMHGDIVEEVYNKLVNKPPQDKVNDVTTVQP